MVIMTSKACTKCGVVKPLSEFGNHRLTKDKLAYRCKECGRKAAKAHGLTPSGIYGQIKSRTNYARKHPNEGRGIPKPIVISREDFIEWHNNTLKVCDYCSIPEGLLQKWDDSHNNKTVRLTIDCMENEPGYAKGNMVLSCLRCNGIKSDIFDHETMREIGQRYVRPIWERAVRGA